ncbi:MAG: ferredoxin--NADP reductase [Candidatus Marinimicrobia bacterium]|nr:ferredoxin--NADP reductase [Candidatus Neomarinimicrobiota bacterium]
MELNAIVSQKIEVTPELIILRVIPKEGTLPDFKPGQFATLGLTGSAARIQFSDPESNIPDPDKLIRRAYSIASSSVNKEYIEFYITIVHSGALTPRLFTLQPGDHIFLGPKITGMFTLDMIDPAVNIIMLSTGTGLAPYMSMLRTQLICGGPRQFAIIHGARHSWDLGYRSELITLANMCSNFTYIPVISRANQELLPWGGQQGYIQDVWEKHNFSKDWGVPVSPENTHVFLCGNPSMIDDMVAILQAQDFSEHTRRHPGTIHLERYW